MDEVPGDEGDAETLQVGQASDGTGGVGIMFERAGMSWICSLYGLVECGENFVRLKRRDKKKTTPDISKPENYGL